MRISFSSGAISEVDSIVAGAVVASARDIVPACSLRKSLGGLQGAPHGTSIAGTCRSPGKMTEASLRRLRRMGLSLPGGILRNASVFDGSDSALAAVAGSPAHFGRSPAGAGLAFAVGLPFAAGFAPAPFAGAFLPGLGFGGFGRIFDLEILAREASFAPGLSLVFSSISETSKTFLHLGHRTDLPLSSGLALNLVWQWTHCANKVILSPD